MNDHLTFALDFIADARRRRIAYAVTIALMAILCVFPEPFKARAKLLPQDSNSAGLGQIVNSLGGQLATFANLLSGGRPPNDLYLIIGRSAAVSDDVISDLKLVGPSGHYRNVRDAKIALKKKVDVRLLLGGVVEIETTSTDKKEALRLTTAYQKAISDRIGLLGRQTIRNKGAIVRNRFSLARIRVAETERRLDEFRRRNRLANPEAQLGSELSLRTGLQAQLQAKLVEFETVKQSAGPENLQLLGVQADIASLRQQLSVTGQPSISSAGPNVTGLSELQSRYLNLFRDYRFSQALYDVYARASEQTEVESLVAESASYIQVVEPTNLDAERHYNISAIALLTLVVTLALFTEWYAPATGLTRRWKRRTAHEQVESGH